MTEHPSYISAQDTDWQACPLCQSTRIEGGPVEIDGRQAWQEIACTDCPATWTEVYTAAWRETIDLAGPVDLSERYD